MDIFKQTIVTCDYKNDHDRIFCTALINESGKSVATYSNFGFGKDYNLRACDSLSDLDIGNFLAWSQMAKGK